MLYKCPKQKLSYKCLEFSNLPPKSLPRSERYDHQKSDREFEVMRAVKIDKCAS